MDKLEPMYQTRLAGGDAETVLQVVELQARIAGLISGGSILLQRASEIDGHGRQHWSRRTSETTH